MSNKMIKRRTAQAGISRRDLMKSASATAATAALMSAVKAAFPAAPSRRRGARGQGHQARLHRADRRLAAVHRQGEGLLRQARHARRGGRQAGLLGRHARQHGARRRGQRHRRRATSCTPMPYLYLDRQGDPEQRADADVHPGAAQPRRPGISVANEYKDLERRLDASPLKAAFEKKKAAGKEVKVAMTFPGGTHDLWIRYWLAAGGIDPDKDISTIVVPPPQMVANMKVGNMDAFCVGEPWNEQLVNQDIGYTAITTGELWFKHPEKIARHARRVGRQESESRKAHPDGRHGGPAVVRQAGEQAGDRRDHRPGANGSTCRSPTSSAASRARSTTATAAPRRAPTCS